MSHAVEICVGIIGEVVVDRDIDSRDVHATGEHVGGDRDTRLEILDVLEMTHACLLSHLGVNSEGWEVGALEMSMSC